MNLSEKYFYIYAEGRKSTIKRYVSLSSLKVFISGPRENRCAAESNSQPFKLWLGTGVEGWGEGVEAAYFRYDFKTGKLDVLIRN